MADAPERMTLQPCPTYGWDHPDRVKHVVGHAVEYVRADLTPPASVVEAMERALDRNCPVCKGTGMAVSGYELLTYHKHGRTEPVEEPCNWCSAGRATLADLEAWRARK